MEKYLAFTVIAAVITTIGTLLGLLIKDFLLVRYFDGFREKRTLEKISKRYKDPIILSATELIIRLEEVCNNYALASKGFKKAILFDKSDYMSANSASDPYFLNYKLVSTLYRFCSFFGWLELYRQDITFLESYSQTKNLKSLSILDKVREALADGQINNGPEWQTLKDVLIFREELRSIGEGMIETINNQRCVIGYGKFQGIISDYEINQKPLWLRPVINFFTDLKLENDFRHKRMQHLNSSLKEFIRCLDKKYSKKHIDNISKIQTSYA